MVAMQRSSDIYYRNVFENVCRRAIDVDKKSDSERGTENGNKQTNLFDSFIASILL